MQWQDTRLTEILGNNTIRDHSPTVMANVFVRMTFSCSGALAVLLRANIKTVSAWPSCSIAR
jgi:hypothetical protein